MVFTAIHVVALVADKTVRFDVVDLFVPGASAWRPLPVALGVVGLWILVAVELTSLLMRHLSRRTWRTVHLASYVLFWIATLHAPDRRYRCRLRSVGPDRRGRHDAGRLPELGAGAVAPRRSPDGGPSDDGLNRR